MLHPLIFALGSNGSGQLGIHHQEDVSVPKNIHIYNLPPSLPPFKQVAAGGNHTLLLLENGDLYSSGDGVSGARGLIASGEKAQEDQSSEFRKVKFMKGERPAGRVIMVAATWEASFVVMSDHQGKATRLFSFGVGMKGELGTGEMIIRTPEATLFKDFPLTGIEILDISACMGHAVVVLSNGEAYGWGSCRQGQIGEPKGIIHDPRKIQVNFKVTKATCCKEVTCLFGEPESGNIAIMGSDKNGLLSDAPNKVPAWKAVGASWGNIYVLKKDGQILAWGRNDHGQLPPPDLTPVTKIAIGSEHVVALTESGDVVSWGWGEHGNCGPLCEGTDVKGTWNTLVANKHVSPAVKVHNIGAGCATSWISLVPTNGQ